MENENIKKILKITLEKFTLQLTQLHSVYNKI